MIFEEVLGHLREYEPKALYTTEDLAAELTRCTVLNEKAYAVALRSLQGPNQEFTKVFNSNEPLHNGRALIELGTAS